MGPGEVFFFLIVVGLPVLASFLIFRSWLRLHEKKLEVDARLAAEKSAQYATNNAALESRLRVLEKIVTDGGLETAAQIEALRSPRLTKGDKV